MTRDHRLVPRRTRRPGAHRAHTTVAAHPAHPVVRRSSFAIAAALTSVALTTTAAVSFTGNDGGAPAAAPAAEPTVQPSAAAADPEVRSAASKADAVLTDAAYVTREGDLSAKERKQVRTAAQDLRAMVDQARETPAASTARPVAASRSTERTSLAERAADASAERPDDAADEGRSGTAEADAGADATEPTNLAGTTTGAAPLADQDVTGLPILDTPLADAVGEPVDTSLGETTAPAEADAAEAEAPAAQAAAAPSAARIEKVTTSLQRLIARTDADAVVSVKAGPTPEEIAAAKKAAEERRAAKAARAAERAAAEAAAKAKAMAEAAKSYGNGQIPADVLCGLSWAPGEQLRCDAAAALEDLNGAFRAAFGRNLAITDGYRSYAEQVAVAASRGALAAVPGTSNHGFGQAVDLSGGIESFGSAEHAWMVANAGRYGWEHPSWAQAGGSKPEAWHWEYGTTY
ncbi:D-alanyl-D-alanine carboxypeptidase family protein [Promicromonospora sp. MS192]|uniref:D-alanyl-D-alanine carboxypeptidase family protein n=1 Tax=Promicromonospora sp. MS192 TaxID=3412684 RepID=UPI003C2CADA2